MNCFGLIGFPLGHSFSKKYFTEKFEQMGLSESHIYKLFELSDIQKFPELLKSEPNLKGINVTIPHKQAIMPFLDGLDASAEKVGAVNVIKFAENGKLIGYNSDYYGFKTSLETFLTNLNLNNIKSLVLGNGGAGKAVVAALKDLGISYKTVSRTKSEENICYDEIPALIADYQLIINCSPVGTYPKSDQCPNIPYESLTENHYLYDLVYNPLETLFLQKGKEKGAKTHNGLPMLHLQAEKAWEIWNTPQ
ncbi:Shikimate dehydrogenase (NADP(+)) [Emticicia aquatica]|jgi:shikimate dehydrogenase|uniref:Shikimate dehydrogenase (NADP(+)) n=1 Tax=Emticicia aquatica TaxID=1681835 RepID=A0ABN8F2H2_9BACT|nr:shikimate dehydrogenase [Emticicia aquatica]CAH0997443.1 Shikimate dehydrogenase (NADP(+)) [Emticicia aquatica]